MKKAKRAISMLLALALAVGMLPATALAEDSIVVYNATGGCIFFDKATGTIVDSDSSVTELDIPSVIDGVAVTAIGEFAFTPCDITRVTIPDSVTSISAGAFARSSRLAAIEVDAGNEVYSSIDGVLFQKEPFALICYPAGKIEERYAVPDGVTLISDYAFFEHGGLASVTIPDSVTEFGDNVFENCGSLTSVTIPDSVPSIGGYAFSGCTGLTDVYYSGTGIQWSTIVVNIGNDPLLNATIHYNSTGPAALDVTVSKTADAAVTAPPAGWQAGQNTFTVSSDVVCYVAVSYDGGNTYSRLPAAAAAGEYSFTADNMDAQTLIAVGCLGDVNGDGSTRAQDARLALQASSGSISLSALQLLSVDLNRDGEVRAQEARQLLQASSGSYELSW